MSGPNLQKHLTLNKRRKEALDYDLTLAWRAKRYLRVKKQSCLLCSSPDHNQRTCPKRVERRA